MRILRSSRKNNSTAPRCGRHGKMIKQGDSYVCVKPGCFAKDQRS